MLKVPLYMGLKVVALIHLSAFDRVLPANVVTTNDMGVFEDGYRENEPKDEM
jgi:hypothetical protein